MTATDPNEKSDNNRWGSMTRPPTLDEIIQANDAETGGMSSEQLASIVGGLEADLLNLSLYVYTED